MAAGIGIDGDRTPEVAIALLPNVREQCGMPVHVWVRNFGLSRSQTLRPANDLDVLLDAGGTDIGVWGFPSAVCSCLDNAEPQRARDAIAETIVRRVVAQTA